ncbi:MAG TPA: N-acetyltransferase, partial [Micromonosporaceae bacterium]|nr:N-acetyltransferase [Micromonosporaceae bacterium]
MDLKITVLADRPDLMDALSDMENPWPEFMRHDPIGNMYYALLDHFADYILVCQNDAGEVVAQALSVPFFLPDDELPDDGWDGAIRRAMRTRLAGVEPNTVSAIEIVIRPDLLSKGLSGTILQAMRDNAARLGFSELVAPVRPNGKSDLDLPMSEYAFQVREDGLPVDPWLRVHVRAGGRIDKVAPRSMVIPGTLAEWREWTGLPFDTSGKVYVP